MIGGLAFTSVMGGGLAFTSVMGGGPAFTSVMRGLPLPHAHALIKQYGDDRIKYLQCECSFMKPWVLWKSIVEPKWASKVYLNTLTMILDHNITPHCECYQSR